MKKGKDFAILLGLESLFMILAIICSCVGVLIQGQFNTYIDDYSSFIWSGRNYQYNYFMYFLGLIVYMGAVYFLYTKFKKAFDHLDEIGIGLTILAWVVDIFWGIVMLVAETITLVVAFLGLSDNLKPEILMCFSLFGWPLMTVLFLGVVFFLKIRKRHKE